MNIARERLFAMVILITISGLVIDDVFEDLRHGSSMSHVATELVIVALCMGGFLYLWFSYFSSRRENRTIKQDLRKMRQDLESYKSETQHLVKGLSLKIDQQFEIWGLTKAEKEVAMLLLKGLSVKEIADVRAASEKTVGQHATSIYHKSHLNGRAELAAFFLEDLFLPSEQIS